MKRIKRKMKMEKKRPIFLYAGSFPKWSQLGDYFGCAMWAAGSSSVVTSFTAFH